MCVCMYLHAFRCMYVFACIQMCACVENMSKFAVTSPDFAVTTH